MTVTSEVAAMASLKPLWLSLGALSEQLRRAETLHLGLDFDGTLTPHRDDPQQATLTPRTLDVIGRLARREGSHLAFLSSRRVDDLVRRVGLPGAFYAGCSGIEVRDEQGRREQHAGSGVPAVLVSELEEWCRRFPGSQIESRGTSSMLHFRAVPADLQPAFGAGVRRRVRPHQPAVTLVHGKTGFELMPTDGWDKAAALDRWLGEKPASGVLLYLGDDTRDEPVHDAVRTRGGYAVAVDRIVSLAEYVLPTADDVVWFLEWLDGEWAQASRAASRAGRLESATP